MAGKINCDDAWVVESGATEHITCIQELIQNITKNPFEPLVTIPNGDHIHVEGRGNCKLQNHIITDKDLHIPTFN